LGWLFAVFDCPYGKKGKQHKSGTEDPQPTIVAAK
jgi:hypothetical protein